MKNGRSKEKRHEELGLSDEQVLECSVRCYLHVKSTNVCGY